MTNQKNKRTAILKLAGHLGAIFTMMCWGSSFISTKVLMGDDVGFTPQEMYTYRFAAAYLILLAISFRKIFSDSWRDEISFMICGVCSGSLYYILENYALQMTTTGNVSLLASISPLFTTLLMAVLFRTRISSGTYIGSVLAFSGVAFVIFNQGFQSLEIHPRGDLLALCASLAWAVYSIVVKRLLPIYNGIFITRKLFFYGVLSSIPLLLIHFDPNHLSMLVDFHRPNIILNFLFLVVMCSIVGFLIWNEVMRILGPVTANNYLYMQPLVTLVVAYFVFDEKIFLNGYLGCILIIGGLIIADKWNPRVRVRFPLRTFSKRKPKQ